MLFSIVILILLIYRKIFGKKELDRQLEIATNRHALSVHVKLLSHTAARKRYVCTKDVATEYFFTMITKQCPQAQNKHISYINVHDVTESNRGQASCKEVLLQSIVHF